MIRKWPLVPTIIVAAAVATMIALGIWQLERREEKKAEIASYKAAADKPPMSWPSVPPKEPLPLFRHATANCLQVAGFRTAAGESLKGEPGYLIIADCRTGAEGPGLSVELGWSKNPNAGRDYKGGLVSGMIAKDRVSRMRLVAATAGPGLMPGAPPSPDHASRTTPAGHLAYAATWFSFAGIALLIYLLAIRQRWRKAEAGANG